MTDSISDSDVRRVDSNTDPTALTDDDLEDAISDDFSDSAKEAFAERVADKRTAVQEQGVGDLSDRIDQNPLTGQSMVRNDSGQFVGAAENVEGTELADNGEYSVTFSDGSTETVTTVDLDAGNSGPASRADRGASNWQT